MKYVDKVREYQQNETLEQAVEHAVNESIKEGILKDFLLQNKAEVVKMSIFEYDEEKHKKMIYAEAYEDGINIGREQGLEQGIEQGMEKGIEQGKNLGAMYNLVVLICRKLKKGKSLETIADELEEDIDTIKSICDVAEQYAPDYDVEVICNELQKQMKH